MAKLSPRIQGIKKAVENKERRLGFFEERKREKVLLKSSGDESEVLHAWDTSDYIRSQIAHRTDQRNWQIEGSKDAPEALRCVTACFARGLTKDRIKHSMGLYFDCCEHQGHCWEGKNWGFHNAAGFLRKLAKCGLEGAWWEAKAGEVAQRPFSDQNPAFTRAVANGFAVNLLRLPKWPMLNNPSKDYEAFMRAGRRACWFAEEYKIGDARMLDFVWATLSRELDDRGWRPEPKILLKDDLWDNWLPRSLMELSLVPKGDRDLF